MKAMKVGALMVVVALLGVLAGYRWAKHGAQVVPMTAAQSSSATVSPADKRKVLYWHDPMRPEVKFDKPGKSPFMDMELVPVYADVGADAGGVAVSAHAQQNLGLRLGQVKKEAIAQRAIAVGTVRYDEHAIALVQMRVAGYVTRLHVGAAQERVRRGQVLAEVVAPAWIEAEGEYLALLKSEIPASDSLRAAARQRLLVLGVPEPAIRAIETMRSLPTSTPLLAPLDGVVTELNLREGASFEMGTVLYRLNGTTTVWIDAQLPEALARMIAPGAAAEIRAAAFPGEVFPGRVQSILPQVDTATRTVGVRLSVRNPSGRLSPGMFVQTALAEPPAHAQLWVPSEAVIATGARSVVIVKRPDGPFDVASVTMGAETEGKTAILSGLTEGQVIVLSGQFLIDSEASLKSAINRLAAPPAVDKGSAP
jgi:membrane fusion protein, copper/silver efflux system